MMQEMKAEQICAYSMRRGKIKGESGVSAILPEISSAGLWTDTANADFRDNSGTRATACMVQASVSERVTFERWTRMRR